MIENPETTSKESTKVIPVENDQFEKIKPVENITVEDLPNKLADLIAQGTRYETVLSDKSLINVEKPGIKLEISFQLKGVQPMPMNIEVQGTKEEITTQIQEKIQGIVTEKGLTGPQTIEFLNAFRILYDTDNPNTSDYGLGTSRIVSQY